MSRGSTVGSGSRIWLIEDNSDDVTFIESAFKRCVEGCELTPLSDGDGIVARLHGTPPRSRPHVILLDLNLPTRDGHDVLADLKSDPELRQIPVIVLTASRRESDVAKSYERHANAHVAKPNDFREYEELAQGIASFWLRVVGEPAHAGAHARVH